MTSNEIEKMTSAFEKLKVPAQPHTRGRYAHRYLTRTRAVAYDEFRKEFGDLLGNKVDDSVKRRALYTLLSLD